MPGSPVLLPPARTPASRTSEIRPDRHPSEHDSESGGFWLGSSGSLPESEAAASNSRNLLFSIRSSNPARRSFSKYSSICLTWRVPTISMLFWICWDRGAFARQHDHGLEECWIELIRAEFFRFIQGCVELLLPFRRAVRNLLEVLESVADVAGLVLHDQLKHSLVHGSRRDELAESKQCANASLPQQMHEGAGFTAGITTKN